MKRIAAVLAPFYFLLTPLFAQHESDWLRFDQPYVKVPVGKAGIYRVHTQDLLSAGFPVDMVDARHLQVFHRGAEQAIIVSGESDGVLDPADYLEFYGQGNDGTLDTELYLQPEFQPHKYHNLFSDTTWYFITAGPSIGKRAEFFQQANSGLSAESHHLAEALLVLASEYSSGKDYSFVASSQLHLTAFDQGEGWMSPLILYNQPAVTFTVSGIENLVTTAGKPRLEMVITGRGNKDHPVDISIGPSARLLTSVNVRGFESVTIEREIEFTDINSNNQLQVHVKVNGTEGPRVSVNYIKVKYAQNFDLAGGSTHLLHLAEQPNNKSYIEIANTPPGTRLFDVTDPGNMSQIGATTGTLLTAVVNNTAVARKIFAGVEHASSTVKPVAIRPIDPDAHNYIVVSHPVLRKPASGYSDPVEAYAAYRASPAGGDFDTLVVNIDLLYDQFNYGEQSPLAIYNLMQFFAEDKLPDYLFLIGEGLDVYYNYFRNPGGYSTYRNLIPTAGYPGSDMAFTANLGTGTYSPAVATGRITATRPEEVAAYLNKVVETEARLFDDLRRKHVLHLSGGIYAGEPQQFRSYLEAFKPTAEGAFLGGKVSAIAKQSTDLELINIADEVNKGVDLVTFFGHSSVSTLDFDIGFVSDPILGYNNKGKYPVLLMNGCDAGAFFVNGKLFGEDWINAANKGAIGFIAHASLGYVNQLRTYTSIFYDVGFGDSLFVTKGLGDIQKETARRYLQNGTSPQDISQAQQMILLGDPAVKLFGASAPDYAIRDEDVMIMSLNELPVTALADSFALRFVVRNYGLAPGKPIHIEVSRTLPDRSVVTYDSTYAPVLYADTLQFIIRGKDIKGAGNNTFAIRADGNNSVEEMEEGNNIGYVDYFIPLNSTQNIYPGKFSIVNEKQLSLSFQHTDILSGERIFLLEVDTAHTFDSPYKQLFEIPATVLVRQPLALLDSDTLVYYWRTKLSDPLQNESRDWSTSSFTYIDNGAEGWAQVSFPQFLDDAVEGLVQDAVLRKTYFQETKTSVIVKTFGAGAGKPADSVSLKISNAEYNLYQQGFGCRANTINLVAFDRNSTVPYIGVPFQWFNRAGRTCGREPWIINSFTPTELYTGNDDDVLAYVDNIAEGDSVLLFNIGDAGYSLWPTEALTKLSEIGISPTQIQSLESGEPVIILGRKGSAPGTARLIRADDGSPADERLVVQKTMTGRYSTGKIKSVLVGPAIGWQSLSLKVSETNVADSVRVDVFGVTDERVETLLFENVPHSFDLSSIDPVVYPFLRLVFTASDDIDLTAAQLEHWIVNFTPVAEGLIFYDGDRGRQTVQEGIAWSAQYGFVNAGNKEFRSNLPVTYKIFNHRTHVTETGTLEIAAPSPGDTTHFTIQVNTFKKEGLNDIEVFVNPEIIREQYYDNNLFLLSKHLEVTGEGQNPVVDVTVDGRYIRNNEYVSPSPKILVKVWDENPYLAINDTTGIELFLAHPCDVEPCQFQRIDFSSSNVTWHAATDTSEFMIRYSPADLPDGKYTMRIMAKDRSGNQAGTAPFEISFIVRNETTISISTPYPNPVRDELNFYCELSGNGEPVKLRLSILNLNGSFAGALDENDFTPLHVGHNILTWDLKKAGEPLPGGLYIYRLTVQTSAGVTEQLGKLVVLR